MLELTGIASVLRGIGVLYWVLAIGAVALAIWKGKTWQRKTLWAVVAVMVFGFLPAKEIIEQSKRDAYAREAWAYFKKKCDTEAGEKIYKTYTGVKSVFVIKPLPPASERDLSDQFWYGDPYSNATPHELRAESAASKLASQRAPIEFDRLGRGFDFVESVIPGKDRESEKIVKFFYPKEARDHLQEPIDRTVSRFGISWEDISTPETRRYWVAGSRFSVIDFTENKVVAERIGFLIESGFGSRAGGRNPWLTGRGPSTTCPAIRNGSFEDRWFILKVLKPHLETSDRTKGVRLVPGSNAFRQKREMGAGWGHLQLLDT